MSTTPIDTWAVDLKDVGAIYPMHGAEFLMVIVGIVLWILWHIWQIKFEDRKYKDEIEAHGTTENLQKATNGNL